ncbi:MAG: hypothetical protein E7049_08060 [Lentisphaerae bacterium]|nr:hypothetical protein [Lentisphaerota bacterium]
MSQGGCKSIARAREVVCASRAGGRFTEAEVEAWRERIFGESLEDPVKVAVEEATGRIFAAMDYDADEKKFRQKINNRLRHLSRPQRAFARAVLNGVTWREMGMAKQTFCFTLKKM